MTQRGTRMVLVLCGALMMGALANAQEQGIWRVNVDSSGGEADSGSSGGQLSEDGRYAVFVSNASNLVPGIPGAYSNVFVHDRRTGVTSCATVDGAGNPAVGGNNTFPGGITRDGRYAAFDTDAYTIVPNDNNGKPDVFVFDLQTGIPERVSVDSNGVEANGSSRDTSITEDGRYVLFSSAANNLDLVLPDTNGVFDLFLHDRQSGTTTRVNLTYLGRQAGGGDTRWGGVYLPGPNLVVFESEASTLVPNNTNGVRDIFVRDLGSGVIERVSVDSNGNQSNGLSLEPYPSADGNLILFTSWGSNLVPGDNNGKKDVFLHDRRNGTTVRVSLDYSGNELVEGATAYGRSPISADGTLVLFESSDPNVVPNIRNNYSNVFLRNLVTGQIRIVNLSWRGEQANDWSVQGSMSRDGRFQSFGSPANNLVQGDRNDATDCFVVGPYLTLEADPEVVAPGGTVTLTTWAGMPASPALTAAVAVNGAPLFAPILRGSLDAQGEWTVSGPAPPALSGNTVTMMSFGFSPKGDLAGTNQETVSFQ